jgi:uncharacterized Zn-binding protein involved in type VI secretion
MGSSAARTKDQQKCLLCDGTKPHKGGDIQHGIKKVLIGGQSAAVVGTACKCESPSPNEIASGSAKVKIGGKDAARKGDKTTHGGTITSGFDKVIMG